MNFKNEILKSIDLPIWIKNRFNEIIFINDSFKSNFNINTNGYEGNLDKYLNSINQLNKLISSIKSLKKETTYTLSLGNNLYKHIIFSYDDSSQNLAGMLIDVSDVRDSYSLSTEKNILQTVIDNIPDLIFYKDKDLRYVGLNKECERFYSQRGVENIIGKNDLELPLYQEFIETCNNHDLEVLTKKKPLYIEESAPIPNSEEYETFQTIKTPIINSDGSIWGLVGVVRDITIQKKLENKLRNLSYTDSLTGLYNRTYFDEKIQDFIDNKQFPIGVIIGDVNGLKIVNDTLGHTEGDKLLKSMSKILCEACEDNGLVFRWGGDEFVVLLPNSSDTQCTHFMDKVNDLCNQDSSDNFKLSIALGHSLLKENSCIDSVLMESEDKVYRQKILSNKSVRSSILSTLKKNLESKNVETEEHTERVSEHCLEVGKALNLDEETIDMLLLVGNLHDIGKIGIPEHILLKPSPLTSDEYEIMKTHAEKGYRLALLLPELSHISRGILTHHERWDGMGYPLGISGEEIPLIARIVAVVDAFDAMTNDRVYSKAISKYDAIKELKNCSGKQFDPKIVDVFCNIISS